VRETTVIGGDHSSKHSMANGPSRRKGMKKALFLSAVSLLAISSLAWAGAASVRETQVDLTTHRASGSLYHTRASADTVQYIGCMVYGTPGSSPGVSCDARDADAERLVCGSTDASLVYLALSISGDSFISFACDGSSLTSLIVNNTSRNLP
jgi:hypothetical protein